MKKHFVNAVTFNNIIKWWLMGILPILIFQGKISKSILWNEPLSFFSYLDEINIILLFPVAIRELYKNREILDRQYLVLFFPILGLIIIGLISGLFNGNSISQTTLGTFDYIKNFLVIFIYAAFFRELKDLNRIFRFLLILTVFLGVIAFIQEFWALWFRYVLQRDVTDIAYLTRNIFKPQALVLPETSWRAGLHREPSLVDNENILGLYILLMLTVYFFNIKKVDFKIVIPLFIGVFTGVSRMVYTAFIYIVVLQIFKGQRWLIVPLIPFAVLFYFLVSSPEFKTSSEILSVSEVDRGGSGWVTFREYGKSIALQIWKDSPVWGVGPGMFGGVISVKYNAPLFKKYKTYSLATYRSLDQFWPQILAEMGIIGTAAFAWLLISIFIVTYTQSRKIVSLELSKISLGLATYIIVILIYTFGSGLNLTPVIFTYSALVGMSLGCASSAKKRELQRINYEN